MLAALVAVAMVVVALRSPINPWASDPGPKPHFTSGDEVYVATTGSLPPYPLDDTGIGIKAGRVLSDGADLILYFDDARPTRTVTLATDVPTTVEGVSFTLCATWIGPKPNSWADVPPGSTEYSDEVYYVYSTDGTPHVCPN